MKSHYTILSIETSLDDTSVAVTQDLKILSNVIYSQVSHHAQWGGTVPDIARRLHQKKIIPTIIEALYRAKLITIKQAACLNQEYSQVFIERSQKGAVIAIPPGSLFEKKGSYRSVFDQIDAVAVTYGPGLAPALEVGISAAKAFCLSWDKPLLAINHMEGHLLSPLAQNSRGGGSKVSDLKFPVLGFLISGGHTQLVLMKKLGVYQILGETLDDAAGEAYDKVARMLKLGYPGGPILAQLALEGEPKYDLPVPMKDRQDLNFSFSGIKTASMYKLKELNLPLTRQFSADFAASFQKAVTTSLMIKYKKAIQIYKPRQIFLGGGVVSNLAIRSKARNIARGFKISYFIPYNKKLFTDNAGMIGVAAYCKAKRGEFVADLNKLDRKPNLKIGYNV